MRHFIGTKLLNYRIDDSPVRISSQVNDGFSTLVVGNIDFYEPRKLPSFSRKKFNLPVLTAPELGFKARRIDANPRHLAEIV